MTERFDKPIIGNQFRMYRYEVIGAYVDFFFSEVAIPTRPSMDEDGYDDVTDYDVFEDFSDEIKLRLLPFVEQISENDYIERSEHIVFDDIRTSQPWGKTPSERILLLKKLRSGKEIGKITTEEFLDKVIRINTKRSDGSEIQIDDIESIDLEITYCYERSFDAVLVEPRGIVFNCDISTFESDNSPGFYVPASIIEYYFGIDRYNFKRQIVSEMLQKEILISPAMIFDAELFEALSERTDNISYKLSREK